MFATHDFVHCWRRMIREMREVVMPTLLDLDARYVQAHVLASNAAGRRLLEFIGFRCRSEILKAYGAFGDDFILYTMTDEDLPNVFRKKSAADPRSQNTGRS